MDVIDHTRNRGISSTPPTIPPLLALFFILSFSSRSRRALSRCRTSETEGWCSVIVEAERLSGGDGGMRFLEGLVEDGGGAVRGL